jgi:hypothetical protein
MSLPFSTLGNFTGSIQSGSILNEQDTSLLLVSSSVDAWFGYSPNDVIELTISDTTDTQISWSVLDQEKNFKDVSLTYIDALNNPLSYTFKELISDFTIFKNSKILLNPISDLSLMGITEGSMKVSYAFVRDLAGSPTKKLTIKDISPSRTEIKIVPTADADNSYTSFCLKKFPVKDVASVLLSIVQKCPYDQIYKTIAPQYVDSIAFLKTIFFLADDGSVLTFLKNLYEDFIKYTTLSSNQIDQGIEPTRIYRIQGIRSYFNNYLLQGYESIADFSDIEKKFGDFTNLRIEQAFSQYRNQTGQDYQNARKFCYDFFFKFFYGVAIHPLQKAHQDKYFSYFKNVLNFGNNKFYPILTHDFLDERTNPSDPLTLIVKLGSALPSDISTKDLCWVSNFGMVPFVATIILQNPVKFATIKIGSPNFGTPTKFITRENVNKLYSSDDLDLNNDDQNNVTINKNLTKLNTDYSKFENFVVFSSAAARLNVFKNKIKTYYTLSGSIVNFQAHYLSALSSSNTSYIYYLNDKDQAQSDLNDLVTSFDGYESSLFNSGKYVYNPSSQSFISASYITDFDASASLYDKTNRDSLINNTPEFVTTDPSSQDYLTFLAMTGHHFDNIYTYISALPIERQVKNQISSSIPTNTLKEMLYSFGWDVDDIISSLDINDVYLNTLNSSTLNALSGQQRLQIIWNRILLTLPGLYKTKGTEECVKYLMACYGLPSSLISIREYGGTDLSDDTLPTYKLDEKTYMLRFSGIGDNIQGPFPDSARTIEFKFAIEHPELYSNWQRVSLFTLYPYNNSQAAWSIDLYKTPGQYTGKVALQMKSGSTGVSIVSSELPIFNGQIFSVMLRRNYPQDDFETNINPDIIPLQYDLVVQRNEDGREIFLASTSSNFYIQDNTIFSQFGRFKLSDGTFIGTLDKLKIWDVPIDDNDFTEHVNDINSYGFSGSNAFQNLWVRLDWDYPQNLYTSSTPLTQSAMWIDNRSPFYAIPNYRTSTFLSSSIVPSVYTQSQAIIQQVWQSNYPTGSVDIQALNFPSVVDPNWSASLVSCSYVSSSIYPWTFRESTYQQDIDGSKFGPNRFKNKKIRQLTYAVESRFDSDDRSTFEPKVTISGESNQIGFFIDPQDSKNKDIVRYVGRNGIMELISDPRNLYSDKYYDLINKNKEYNAHGNKQTLFNELLTIYKFYFDKSIFEAIKNVLPARANTFTGVIIEPTVLERPKYQNRPITSSANLSYVGEINNIYTFSANTLWGNFNTGSVQGELPPSYQQIIDLTDINNGKREYSPNISNGYITDFMDRIQFSVFPDFETFPRLWAIPSASYTAGNIPFAEPINGTVSQRKPGDLVRIGSDPGSVDPLHYYTGLNPGTHLQTFYMLKVWDKFDYFFKTGPYSHSENPLEDTYTSSSIMLYKYIIADENYMRSLIYFTDLINVPAYDVNDVSNVFSAGIYYHRVNTFINTPDQNVSNVVAVPGPTFGVNPLDFTLGLKQTKRYFELPRGFPRNHYTHKMLKFSKTQYPRFVDLNTNSIYLKGRQTIDTTINENGINDGTFPVTSTNVSNVNVMNPGNVIQTVVGANTGTVIPGAASNTTTNASQVRAVAKRPTNQTPVGGNSQDGNSNSSQRR